MAVSITSSSQSARWSARTEKPTGYNYVNNGYHVLMPQTPAFVNKHQYKFLLNKPQHKTLPKYTNLYIRPTQVQKPQYKTYLSKQTLTQDLPKHINLNKRPASAYKPQHKAYLSIQTSIKDLPQHTNLNIGLAAAQKPQYMRHLDLQQISQKESQISLYEVKSIFVQFAMARCWLCSKCKL